MIIDTHAHLYLEDFTEDLKELEARAQHEAVNQVLLPNIDITTIDALIALAKTKSDFYKSMVGLHPCYVKEDYQSQLDKLYTYFESANHCAVGEIGIDLYWDKSFVKEQQDAFRRQIIWAQELKLPIVIHSRDSLDMTIDIVTEMQNGDLTGVFHCFNGTLEQSQKIIDVGFYMGIGGVVTFKNAGVDKVVSQIPLHHLVLETDAPYLSPVPYRGKRNEPSYIAEVLDKVASVKEISREEVAKTTTENAQKLFKL